MEADGTVGPWKLSPLLHAMARLGTWVYDMSFMITVDHLDPHVCQCHQTSPDKTGVLDKLKTQAWQGNEQMMAVRRCRRAPRETLSSR